MTPIENKIETSMTTRGGGFELLYSARIEHHDKSLADFNQARNRKSQHKSLGHDERLERSAFQNHDLFLFRVKFINQSPDELFDFSCSTLNPNQPPLPLLQQLVRLVLHAVQIPRINRPRIFPALIVGFVELAVETDATE